MDDLLFMLQYFPLQPVAFHFWVSNLLSKSGFYRQNFLPVSLCNVGDVKYRVFRKNCVFHNSLQPLPSLAYIAVRDLQSSQRNASVQSLLLAGNFLYNQQQPSAGEGEVANFREFFKKQYLINTL